MINVLPKPDEKHAGDSSLIHSYCGNVYPTVDGVYIAHCGADITSGNDTEDEDNLCSMCVFEEDMCMMCN